MSEDIAIRVNNLSKVYKLYDSPHDRFKETFHPFRKKYHHDFYALRDISFEVKKGETIGIIGKNGSGKSTLLKILTGVLTPSDGTVEVSGAVSALLELGAGFNPEFTGIQNIYLSGTIMGYTREMIRKRLDDILAFADIGEFVHQPVRMYSSGMYVRLAFAVAINVDPDVLIIDEALSVGDIRFQQKCFRKIMEFKEKGKTILLVTHDPGAVINFCSEAIWLNEGSKFLQGEPDHVCKRYRSFMTYDRMTTDVVVNREVAYPVETMVEEAISDEYSISSIERCDGYIEIRGGSAQKNHGGNNVSENESIFIVLQNQGMIHTFETSRNDDGNKASSGNGNTDHSGFICRVPESSRMSMAKIGIMTQRGLRYFLHHTGQNMPEDTSSDTAISEDSISWDDVGGCSSFGEGGARIKRVALYKRQPFEKATILGGGEDVVYLIDAEILKDIYHPIFGFIIKDEYGNNFLAVNTFVYNVDMGTLNQDTRLIVKFFFSFPNFKAGHYTFSPAIAEGTQDNHIQHHWVHDANIITINNPAKRFHIGGAFILDNVRFEIDNK